MSAHALSESERIRLAFARETQRPGYLENRAQIVGTVAYLVAAVALLVALGVHGHFSPALAAMYVLAIAAAWNVRIDVGAGYTIPTQVVLVPMLFALPVTLVPVLVPLGMALGLAPAIVRGRAPLSRLLTLPSNSWFAWGPALVLALTHDHSPFGRVDVLVVALIAQVACDFWLSALHERLAGGISVRQLAEEVRTVYLIDSALAAVGLGAAFAAAGRPWAVLLFAPLFAVLGVFSRERRVRLEQMLELHDAYRGTALVLGDVVEADDTYTAAHCRSVVRLALEVAGALGLDADQRRKVEFGALLHDVGKIAVPKEIINKPAALDESEWALIKTHTIEGQRMLERVGGIMREVGLVVRHSHERWDGAGYPDGLSGEAIPLEARIVCACDAFNAMTTTRVYRRAMNIDDAVAELLRNSGTQFDPRVVDALIGAVTSPPPIEKSRARRR